MSFNIANSLKGIAQLYGAKTGIVEVNTGKKLTFSQLEARSDEYAWYLRDNGVSPGDRVMLMVKPSADFICLTFALFKIGSPVILIDPGMGYKNLLRCVSGVKPTVFIGIPKAHLFLRIFKKTFKSIQQKYCCGFSFGMFGNDFRRSAGARSENYPIFQAKKDDLAAIIFTTGSTGPPKGVRYEHGVFSAQLRLIKEYYKIGSEDIDQPAFPLFALFSTAIGACAVIPDMDSTKPAKVNPEKFVNSLLKYGVTYSFGSPALWKVVSDYCKKEQILLKKLKKVLMAGAPVSGELIANVSSILSEDAQIHTPYGATESLPIVSIEGEEILKETWFQTKVGKGTCVGRPLPGIDINIISLSNEVIDCLDDSFFVGDNVIGEIIVSGDVVTKAYENNEHETNLSKTIYNNKLWHRMGDTGYLDSSKRLWFCGRKAHVVKTSKGDMFTIQCEAIVNNHRDIFRSALVGITNAAGSIQPVLVLEVEKNCQRSKEDILEEVKILVAQSQLTENINHFLFHDDFPVDIRHNAKIFREKLTLWAQEKLHTNE